MNRIFYIADTHFGHENVIKFDGRPFPNIEEMETELIKRWNETVNKKDYVYILGDFIWKDRNKWETLPKLLNGKKILIVGNHDLRQFTPEIQENFLDIQKTMEIKDSGRRVILCHYPMPFYRADYNENMYHLYGHVHNTDEDKLMEELRKYILEHDNREISKTKCQFYNAWLGYHDWKPATLDEIIERWKERSA